MRVVVDAQRRAVLEDHARRALDLDRERVEWIFEPADFKLLAIERTRFDGAAIVVRNDLVVLVAPPDQRAFVWKRLRSELVAGGNEVARTSVERDMEFRIGKARALDDRLVITGQKAFDLAQTHDAHGRKIL